MNNNTNFDNSYDITQDKYCDLTQRKISIQNSILFNGIDYIELNPWQSTTYNSYNNNDNNDNSNKNENMLKNPLLFIYCFSSVRKNINGSNIVISGGERIKNIKILWARRADQINDFIDIETDSAKEYIDDLEQKDNVIIVKLGNIGDRSNYLIKLVQSTKDPDLASFEGFDNLLSVFEFSFEILCNGKEIFDCYDDIICKYDDNKENSLENINELGVKQDSASNNYVDYMAKDYSSFLELIHTRMAEQNPGWKPKNPADIETVLFELAAYVGDHLSYYQDAVATESYLGYCKK